MVGKLSFVRNVALAMALAVGVVACSDADDDAAVNGSGGGGDAGSGDAAGDADGDNDEEGGSDAGLECAVQEDGTCPEGCLPLKGFPYDYVNACLLEEVVFGCALEDGGDTAIGCYVNDETGTYIWTPVRYEAEIEGYRACTEWEQSEEFDLAFRCE